MTRRVPRRPRASDPVDPTACTLEELTGIDWGEEPAYPTHLVREHFRLGRVPIGEIDEAGLRLLIAQRTGERWLVPLALARLRDGPWLATDFHEGDLLGAVLGLPAEFWAEETELAAALDGVATRAVFLADPPRRRPPAVAHDEKVLRAARDWLRARGLRASFSAD